MARVHKVKKQREIGKLSAAALMGTLGWPRLPIRYVLWRISPRKYDPSAMGTAFKAIQDGIAEFHGVPDDEAHGLHFEYRQIRGNPKEYAVAIEVRHEQA